jgi:hypothetical protein
VAEGIGVKLTVNVQLEPAASVPGVDEPEETSGQADEALLSRVKFGETLGLLPVLGIGKVSGALPMFKSCTA